MLRQPLPADHAEIRDDLHAQSLGSRLAPEAVETDVSRFTPANTLTARALCDRNAHYHVRRAHRPLRPVLHRRAV